MIRLALAAGAAAVVVLAPMSAWAAPAAPADVARPAPVAAASAAPGAESAPAAFVAAAQTSATDQVPPADTGGDGGPDGAVRKAAALAGYLAYGLMWSTLMWGLGLTTGIVQRFVRRATLYGGHMVLAVTVPAGTTKQLTWTFTTAGTTLYGCHEPGHYASGMKGTVTVT